MAPSSITIEIPKSIIRDAIVSGINIYSKKNNFKVTPQFLMVECELLEAMQTYNIDYEDIIQ